MRELPYNTYGHQMNWPVLQSDQRLTRLAASASIHRLIKYSKNQRLARLVSCSCPEHSVFRQVEDISYGEAQKH